MGHRFFSAELELAGLLNSVIQDNQDWQCRKMETYTAFGIATVFPAAVFLSLGLLLNGCEINEQKA